MGIPYNVMAWLNDIKWHYGTLDEFHDAHTIRIQLRGLNDWLKEHHRIADTLTGQLHNEWHSIFREEVRLCVKLQAALRRWLKKRDLKP